MVSKIPPKITNTFPKFPPDVLEVSEPEAEGPEGVEGPIPPDKLLPSSSSLFDFLRFEVGSFSSLSSDLEGLLFFSSSSEE
jgi:hypothetical protein